MKKSQLTELVIIPTLKEIPKGFSAKSLLAVQMIIAHESKGGHYLAQKNGVALGAPQMEPITHDDVWVHGASVWENAVDLGIITHQEYTDGMHPPAERLIYDLRYAVFMTRQRLFMDTNPLPDSPEDMAIYLKDFWNAGGKATAAKYYFDYKNWA